MLKCRIFQLAKVNHGYVKHIYLISGRNKNDSSSSNSNYNSFGSYDCRFEVYLYLMYLWYGIRTKIPLRWNTFEENGAGKTTNRKSLGITWSHHYSHSVQRASFIYQLRFLPNSCVHYSTSSYHLFCNSDVSHIRINQNRPV